MVAAHALISAGHARNRYTLDRAGRAPALGQAVDEEDAPSVLGVQRRLMPTGTNGGPGSATAKRRRAGCGWVTVSSNHCSVRRGVPWTMSS